MNLDDAAYYEQRPWVFWEAAFKEAGLPFPEVILTECGFDSGVQNFNGWRHNLSEADYAAYLRRLPGLTPQAKFRTIFAWRCTGDWAALGFEIEDAEMVEQAIADANKEAPMPTDLAHEIWDECWRWRERPGAAGYNPDTAIGTYREVNPHYGMPNTGEFDGRAGSAPWPVVVQVFAGGIILARKRDWKTMGARSESELRDILSGPLA